MNKKINGCKLCTESQNIDWDSWQNCLNCVNNYSRFNPSNKTKQFFLGNGYILKKLEKTPIIIMGFPGVGKTYTKELFKGTDIKILDSDSSNFKKDKFPDNYIKYLESVYNDFDLIFISTHKDVREAIKKSILIDNCFIAICFPDKSIKNEWIERLQNRGNNKKFCKLIEDNYDNWIDDINSDDTFYKLKITKEEENLLYNLRWYINCFNLNNNLNTILKLSDIK